MVTNAYESAAAMGASSQSQSGVSWAAIFAGALAAAVLSLLLFMLGIGLGLSSVSAWSGQGVEGSTLGWSAIGWLVLTQLASAGVGGYLAGRLRTKWQGVHTDEVYFRDTAHGFLSWSLSTLIMVVLMGSVLGSAISGVGRAAATVASGATQAVASVSGAVLSAGGSVASAAASGAAGLATGAAGLAAGRVLNDDDLQYWIQTMMRNGGPTQTQKEQVADAVGDAADQVKRTAAQVRSAAEDAREVGVIFTQALRKGELPESDAAYAARLIARHSQASQQEAQETVKQTFAQIQQQIDNAQQALKNAEEAARSAADTARSTAARSMLWIFVVLMSGAFVGSLAATMGGRQRNNA